MNDTARIRFECPQCENRLRVAATAAGKQIRCPRCTKVVEVPPKSEVEEARINSDSDPRRAIWPWFAGGGAVLLLLVGVGVWVIAGTKDRARIRTEQAAAEARQEEDRKTAEKMAAEKKKEDTRIKAEQIAATKKKEGDQARAELAAAEKKQEDERMKGELAAAEKKQEEERIKNEKLVAEKKKDTVEAYIQAALDNRDQFKMLNACIFRPDDPRLTFNRNEFGFRNPKDIRPGSFADMLQKAELFATLYDAALRAGLKGGAVPKERPTAKTDDTEARILMDKDIVGNGACGFVNAKPKSGPERTALAFESPCSHSIATIAERYGAPNQTIKIGTFRCCLYGRILFVENTKKAVAVFRWGNNLEKVIE